MVDALETPSSACHRQQGKCSSSNPDEPFTEMEMILSLQVVRHAAAVCLAVLADLDFGWVFELALWADFMLFYL